MLCQGLIFETSVDETNVWFSAFVILLLVCCIVFNIKQGVSRVLKQHLQSVVVPSGITEEKNVSRDTIMEMCQLNSLYQLTRNEEMEIDCQRLIEIASSASNPFAMELPKIKKFLNQEMAIWNDPTLFPVILAQRTQNNQDLLSIQEDDEDKNDWAKHTNDFILRRSIEGGTVHLASMSSAEAASFGGSSFPSSPSNGKNNVLRVESIKVD
jgi:hypothetical protein